jgi:hypothetical protein
MLMFFRKHHDVFLIFVQKIRYSHKVSKESNKSLIHVCCYFFTFAMNKRKNNHDQSGYPTRYFCHNGNLQ